MIENNYNEKQYRLVSNELSYQRLLLNKNGENTNIKYIGNYFDNDKTLNLTLNTTDIISNTSNRNLLIDQITIFSTNPNISNNLPLQFDLAGKQLYFIASGDTSEIAEYDILYNKLGLYDNLKNAEFNKFELVSTNINFPTSGNSILQRINGAQIVSIKNNNNEIKIYISIGASAPISGGQNFVYYGLLNDLKQLLNMNQIVMNNNIRGRLKTNGYNVLIANVSSTTDNFLYDVRNDTNTISIFAGSNLKWSIYQPVVINNTYFTYTIASNYNLISRLYLIDKSFLDINVVEYICNQVDNDTKRIISNIQSLYVINLNLLFFVSKGNSGEFFGSCGYIFINTIDNTFDVKYFKPTLKTRIINGVMNPTIPEYINYDMGFVIDENTNVNLKYTDKITNFKFYAYLFNTKAVDDIDVYLIENGEIFDYNDNLLNEYDCIFKKVNFDFANQKTFSVQNYRNLLIAENTPINNKLNYDVINLTDNVKNVITSNDKLYKFTLTDFYVNNDIFIELGYRLSYDNNNYILDINFSENKRENKVYMYNQDYASYTFTLDTLNNMILKFNDDINKVEIVKIIIDFRLRNSKIKEIDIKEQVNKKDKLKRKLRKKDLDIKNILNAGDEELPLIQDLLHLI